MEVLEVTTKQFRKRQKTFLDLADTGKQIIIRRSSNGQSYTLAPLNDDNLYFTPEMEARIERSIQQIENGECSVIKDKEELRLYFDSL